MITLSSTDLLGCPFCGALPQKFEQKFEEAKHFESAQIKHKPGCWFHGETILSPFNIQRWRSRSDSTECGNEEVRPCNIN